MKAIQGALTFWMVCLFCFPLIAREADDYPYDLLAIINNYMCNNSMVPIPHMDAQGTLPSVNASFVVLCISNSFSASDKKMVERAFRHLIQKLGEKSLYQCVTQSENSPKNLYDEKRLFELLRIRPFQLKNQVEGVGLPTAVFISCLDKSSRPQELGDGYFDFFSKQEEEGIATLSLAVTGGLIGTSSVPHSHRADFWAAVLGMSLAKNMGISSDPSEEEAPVFQALSRCLLKKESKEKK